MLVNQNLHEHQNFSNRQTIGLKKTNKLNNPILLGDNTPSKAKLTIEKNKKLKQHHLIRLKHMTMIIHTIEQATV
jgi:hypothetical protein